MKSVNHNEIERKAEKKQTQRYALYNILILDTTFTPI
jgi:hypothetical protein